MDMTVWINFTYAVVDNIFLLSFSFIVLLVILRVSLNTTLIRFFIKKSWINLNGSILYSILNLLL